MTRRLLSCVALLGLAASALSGCFSTDNGPQPDPSQLLFPTGLVVSPGGSALYIANSDFDLQYKAGTVQVLDLARVRQNVPHLWAGKSCEDEGLASPVPQDQLLFPSVCASMDINAPVKGGGSLIKNTVSIGAFATDAILAMRPDAPGARLLIPVRGDPSLTWIDVDDDSRGSQTFALSCGQSGAAARCGDDHKAGMDPGENTRAQTMPGEPFEVALSDPTDAAVVTHQTSGAASLFLNGWPGAPPRRCAKLPEHPQLSFVLGGLPTGATGIGAFPEPRLAKLDGAIPYQPAFLVSYRTAAVLDVLRYYDDCASAPDRPFLARTAEVGIFVNAAGFDSRSIAMDTRARKKAEADCDATGVAVTTADDGSVARDPGTNAPLCPDGHVYDPSLVPLSDGESIASDDEVLSTLPCVDRACLTSAAAVPVGVYVANRTPPSLIVGETRATVSPYGTDDAVTLFDQIPLSEGASRVAFGSVIGRDGLLHPRVFALAFDARLLYVYDPDVGAMESIMLTGRGPAAMAFDPTIASCADGNPTRGADCPDGGGAFLYLAHFTDSYIGVVDLDMRNSTYLSIVLNVGVPRQPPESQ